MAFTGITINTPAEDEAHIYAEDDAAIYQSIFGVDGVLDIGSKLSATIQSNNTIRISDGVIVCGGHIGRNRYADYTDITITNGTPGRNRIDLIVAEFSTSGFGGTDAYTIKNIRAQRHLELRYRLRSYRKTSMRVEKRDKSHCTK